MEKVNPDLSDSPQGAAVLDALREETKKFTRSDSFRKSDLMKKFGNVRWNVMQFTFTSTEGRWGLMVQLSRIPGVTPMFVGIIGDHVGVIADDKDMKNFTQAVFLKLLVGSGGK